ncbi:hypothetical protein J5837_02220 [Pseudoxanthomonas helianthi]|uniref:DUF1453 domain-containing protein n=1 Tax=Pseudoxanthomonas helianthi TaxID=1453541 RepID=A0A940X0B9_9GAMM|nr:hypothetical protein [Pseudoxanthomonas helianthi]MBP3983226.1 hypothetical protein [Pseudoxanthomonas helianthi]
MPAALAPYAPYLATAAIGWAYYRRIRRSFGRQRWQPVRTTIRLALVSVALVGLIVAAAFLPHVVSGIAIGVAAGVVLGGFALRHTHAEWRDGQGWYTPNPWIGGALTLLLLGRLAWRYANGAFSGAAAQTAQQASPLTLGIAAALVSYSLVNGAGLLLRMRRLSMQVNPSALQ